MAQKRLFGSFNGYVTTKLCCLSSPENVYETNQTVHRPHQLCMEYKSEKEKQTVLLDYT